MAFRQPAENTNNQSWKSQGFINFYLPTADGKGRRKLGAVPLQEANLTQKPLLDWLKEDPTRVAKILAQLQIEFRLAEPAAGSGFALPT